MRLELDVNGKPVEFVLDTGSQASLIKSSTWKLLKSPLYKTDQVLLSAGGHALDVKGKTVVNITGKRSATTALVYVVGDAQDNLLGHDEIEEMGLLVLVNEVKCVPSSPITPTRVSKPCVTESTNAVGSKPSLFDPTKEFPELFEGLGCLPDEFSIVLKPNTKPRHLFSPRSIAAGLRPKAKAKIDEMLSMGVIEPVEEPTEWCSGLTIVPKANGDIRMCVDLTALNKGVCREPYPLPRVSELLARVAEGRYFSKLDANSGFWQMRMNPESKLLTTFITPWGRYCFKKMPFGISSAPEVFQRTMEKILQGLDGVICLMDDILIFAKDEATHWERVRKVLQRCTNAGLTLRKDKCQFATTSVKFLGHVVSERGVESDPDKVKAICDMQPPRNTQEVRRFIGMVNYLSKFSGKLAGLCCPLYAVMGKRKDMYWGGEQQNAFELIKLELANSPVLCAFDLSKRHRVSADASKLALGAVLLQEVGEELWQPVEYASRKMTDTETRYAMVEKEALAITWACEKFDYYLIGRKFEVETDHKPLVAILGGKDLSDLPPRVQRFKMRMMRYGYEIFHTPGVKMFVADALSRPNCAETKQAALRCASVECYVDSVFEELFDDVREKELFQATSADEVAKLCLKYLVDGWPMGKKLQGELKKLYSCRHRLSEYKGCLMFNDRLYVPKSLRAVYLERAHAGHQGIGKTSRRVRQVVWWPNMIADVESYINRCNVCIKQSAVKHQPCHDNPLPSGPWVEIASDVMEYKDKLYCVIADYYSKWIEAVPIGTQSSAGIIGAMRQVFSTLGVPKKLRSDNGPGYRSSEFRKFASDYGFEHVTSSPRYPQSNGLAERAVGIVKRLFRKCSDHDLCMMSYRTTPLTSGFSPSELMFGRTLRSPLGLSKELLVDFDQFEQIESDNVSKRREKWNHKFRAKFLPPLKPNQRVWVKAPSDPGSEGIVLRPDDTPQSYWVQVGPSELRRNRKHLFVLYDDVTDFSDHENDHVLPLSLEADYYQTRVENGTDVSNNALCAHPNIVSSDLSSDVFSDLPPSTSPAVVEDRQEDSHSEGGLAVSVDVTPTETQEYPNNTPEVQMEKRSVLDLAVVTPALQCSNASTDTVFVHEVPDASQEPNVVKTSLRGRRLKSGHKSDIYDWSN